MRRVRRWLIRLVVLAALVLGSLLGLDQWLLHADEPKAAESGQAAAPEKPARPVKRSKIAGPFGSPEACQAAWEARAKAPVARGPRIATWNIRWFPLGSRDGKRFEERTDVAWLACAIALLDVDVLAVQELLDGPEARRAQLDLLAQLDALTGGRHRLELDDCTGSGRQHVGLLWNEARVKLEGLRSIAALNPAGSMCASSLRPGFGGRARFADGSELHVITVHLDSGEKARDYEHRASSVSALAGVLQRMGASDEGAIVLGDYNTMGCPTCSPAVSAEDELALLDASLARSSLQRLEHPLGNRCSHYYKGRAALLDLAVITPSLKERVASVRAEGVCGALACERPKRGETPLAWDVLSDHCPVVVQLEATRKAAH